MDLWNKTTTTLIFDVIYVFLYLVENLWCLFNIVYDIVYRSVFVNTKY